MNSTEAIAETADPTQGVAAAAPRVRGWWSVFGIGCLAGLAWAVLTGLSLPPFSLWILGLLAPMPIVAAGWWTPRAWACAFGMTVGSLPLWIFHHSWVSAVSFAGVFPMIGYLAMWSGLTVLVLAKVRRVAGVLGPAVVAPTAWVGLEFVRGEIAFEGYAWFLAGHPLIEAEVVARAASVGGVYLVSWLVVAIGGIAMARRSDGVGARRAGWVVSAILIALLGVSVIAGGGRASTELIRVGALQTNVPQDNKMTPSREQLAGDLRDLVSIMDDAVAQGAELVVTPETVLPGGLLDPAARAVLPEPFGGTLLGEQRRAGVPMLAGCTTLRGLRDEGDRLAWDGVLNSVFLLVDGEAVGPRYDKLRPTPFGETLPYVQSLPWLRDLILQIGLGASGMDFGLDRGSEVVAFEVPVRGGAVTVTTPICFESSMAPTVRKLVNGAREQGRPTELLAVVTNDGWFGWFDPGREMHLLQARWRCVEHRLPMVRTANTGVSALIDHRGRVLASLPARQAGALVGDVLLGTGVPTLYQRIGDAFGAGCAVVTLLAFIAGIVAGRRIAPAGRAEAAERDADGQGATT